MSYLFLVQAKVLCIILFLLLIFSTTWLFIFLSLLYRDDTYVYIIICKEKKQTTHNSFTLLWTSEKTYTPKDKYLHHEVPTYKLFMFNGYYFPLVVWVDRLISQFLQPAEAHPFSHTKKHICFCAKKKKKKD